MILIIIKYNAQANIPINSIVPKTDKYTLIKLVITNTTANAIDNTKPTRMISKNRCKARLTWSNPVNILNFI